MEYQVCPFGIFIGFINLHRFMAELFGSYAKIIEIYSYLYSLCRDPVIIKISF